MAGGAGGATPVGVVAPVPPPADPVVWKTTPFSGNFNPGTKLGQDIFHRKTKGLNKADHLDLTEKNS